MTGLPIGGDGASLGDIVLRPASRNEPNGAAEVEQPERPCCPGCQDLKCSVCQDLKCSGECLKMMLFLCCPWPVVSGIAAVGTYYMVYDDKVSAEAFSITVQIFMVLLVGVMYGRENQKSFSHNGFGWYAMVFVVVPALIGINVCTWAGGRFLQEWRHYDAYTLVENVDAAADPTIYHGYGRFVLSSPAVVDMADKAVYSWTTQTCNENGRHCTTNGPFYACVFPIVTTVDQTSVGLWATSDNTACCTATGSASSSSCQWGASGDASGAQGEWFLPKSQDVYSNTDSAVSSVSTQQPHLTTASGSMYLQFHEHGEFEEKQDERWLTGWAIVIAFGVGWPFIGVLSILIFCTFLLPQLHHAQLLPEL